MPQKHYAHWLQEFQRHLSLKNLFLLYGNIYDLLPYPVRDGAKIHWSYFPLNRLLQRFFRDRGYETVVFYDLVDGLTFKTEAEKSIFNEISRDDFDAVLDAVRQAIGKDITPLAVVIDHASRLITTPGHLSQRERQQFIKLLKCIKEAAVKTMGCDLNHVLVLVCDRLPDLPAWLYLNNPLAKPLHIGLPTEGERRSYFEIAAGGFYAGTGARYDQADVINTFVDLTRGLTNYELECLRLVSLTEKIDIGKPKRIVEHYKFGVRESAWDLMGQKEGKAKLARADEILRKRVKGQDAAIVAVVDIIKRAATGLSGIHHSASYHKPKGILFFAGPTGVGKTEMARSLAELLFGDENACMRFDMSEYAQEHSDQRLLGAPPGYVGYEEGGQLTNKIKETPFTVLLFDEIEKAHPKIMDKFLQILEDGRMTDGKGETVYFSEAVIIFTSNIGAYEEVHLGDGVFMRRPCILPYSWRCQQCGRLFPEEKAPAACVCGKDGFGHVETPYPLVRERILQAIETYFKSKLGRPEIYNRIGNNFVVFDYIRTPVVGEIIDKILGNIKQELKEKRQLTVEFAPPVHHFLQEKAAGNIEQGGRGIGNFIETALINPMARLIFDREIKGGRLLIRGIREIKNEAQTVYEVEA